MDWDEAKQLLLEGDPELAHTYNESEPAYMVAREVLKARGQLHITQAELARRMGTSQSVVSRIENMDGSPNLKTVLALAKALGRKLDLQFVDPAVGVKRVEDPEALSDWVFGTRDEFIAGITALVTDQVYHSTQVIRDLRVEHDRQLSDGDDEPTAATN